MSSPAANRLQMVLAAAWLDAGSPQDGSIEFEVADLLRGLDVDPDRPGMLHVLTALGELEEAGDVQVVWTTGRARGTCVLSGPLRRSLSLLDPRRDDSA